MTVNKTDTKSTSPRPVASAETPAKPPARPKAGAAPEAAQAPFEAGLSDVLKAASASTKRGASLKLGESKGDKHDAVIQRHYKKMLGRQATSEELGKMRPVLEKARAEGGGDEALDAACVWCIGHTPEYAMKDFEQTMHARAQAMLGRKAKPEEIAKMRPAMEAILEKEGGGTRGKVEDVISFCYALSPEYTMKDFEAVNNFCFAAMLGRGPKAEETTKLREACLKALTDDGGGREKMVDIIKFCIALTDEYKARQPQTIDTPDGPMVQRKGHLISERIAHQFDQLDAAARAAGINLQITSAYRSHAQQVHLYNLYLAGKGNIAAKPGTSHHQTGTAIDFTNTPGAWAWLKANAHKYGLHNFPPEPWHYSLNGH